jgi:ribonuclease Y
MEYTIIIAVATFVLGGLLSYLLWNKLLTKKRQRIVQDAEAEAEVIRKEKILQAKEKFLQLKSEHEKVIAEKNSRMAQAENKIKQRELLQSQKLEELQRKQKELDAIRENLTSQMELVEKRNEELEKMHKAHVEKLEALSGLSAEEAKAQLIESLKAEAKTSAMSYINEIMDEAKMTAAKESKRIIVQTIQRVASETAIENSVTVFNIDSDEIKGRIIGREGRNIRALEAATALKLLWTIPPRPLSSRHSIGSQGDCRLAIHQLVTDGRIHPARIEEVVQKVQKQVEEEIIEVGKRTAIDLGIHGLHPELIRLVGKMSTALRTDKTCCSTPARWPISAPSWPPSWA